MKEGERRQRLRVWLSIVGSATLVLGASYTMLHQSARLNVDDKPLSVVQEAKAKIADDVTPADIVPEEEIDLRNSSGVFLIITDSSKEVLASSAILDDKSPLPPDSVFSDAEKAGSDRFTWEPTGGVRLATQVLKYEENGGGFIMAGQSLKQTEERLEGYKTIAVTAWVAIVAWTLIVLFTPSKSAVFTAGSKKRSTK